jgi:hypothetical protein
MYWCETKATNETNLREAQVYSVQVFPSQKENKVVLLDAKISAVLGNHNKGSSYCKH